MSDQRLAQADAGKLSEGNNVLAPQATMTF